MTSGLGNISCNITVKGKQTGTTTPTIDIEETKMTECLGGSAEAKTLGTVQVHHDVEHNATLTISGLVFKMTQAGVPCYWESKTPTGENLHGTLTGGNPATVHITSEVIKIDTASHDSSAFCPSKATWHTTFKITEPKPVFVSTH